MKILKQLFAIILLSGSTGLTIAQPDYIQQTQSNSANFYTLQSDFYSWQSNQTSSPEITSSAKKFARFEMFWKDRVVNNEVNTGSFSGYSAAALYEWSTPRCTSSDDSRWEPVGPFPSGTHNMGMIKALWNDPNNQNFIIVGSGRNSGIFRSLDGGNTWDDVLTPQKLPALGINSFAVSPNKINNKRVIYAGTGEYNFSIGIIKSTDDGLTWNTVDAFPFYDYANATLPPNYKVQKVIVPQNLSQSQQDIVYAIARNSFLKSTTGGTTWETPYMLGSNVGEAVDIEVVSTDYNKLFISTNCITHYQANPSSNVFDYPAKLFYSTNGGTSWNDITANIAGNDNYSSIHIEILPNGTLYVHYSIWGGNTYIKKSSDNGLSWTSILVPASPSPVALIPKGLYGNESFKVSSQTGIVYQGSTTPFKNNTNMYGYATTANTHCDIRAIQIIPTSTDDIIIIANDGGVSKSYDGGTTWNSLNGVDKKGIMNSELHGFDISKIHEDRIIVGRQDNGTSLMFKNEWQNQNIFGGDGEECLFKPNDDTYLYSVNNCEIRKGMIVNGVVTSQTFTSDPGINCYTYATADKFLGRPIAMNKQFPNRMYAGKKGGMLNITSDDGTTWNTVQLKESDGVTNVSASIVDIEISELQPNIMYIVTDQILWNGSGTSKNSVFRSSDYGQNWTDITTGISQSIPNQWMSVTDLTIDYSYPNKIWVSMGSVKMDAAGQALQRVYRCDNADASSTLRDWNDITTNSISPLPVTTIINHPGTNRVFIGTDAGVFYYENNDWHCFSKDLPITWIKDMKINQQTSELYIGTYGNGIWKTPLPCFSSTSGNMEITSSILVQNNVFHNFDIIIKNNSTLTFTGGAIMSMGAGNKIIIEPGSKLVIDNATVTSGCGSYWAGIEVWGDKTKSQYPSTNQGVVQVINGGTIRNAETAIKAIGINANGSFDWNKTGGIVQLDGAKLINNNFGVWIGAYHSYFGNTEKANASYIKNSHFEFNNNMLVGHTGFTHIGLFSIGRLNILGNDFINTRLDKNELSTELRGMGIISYDAKFNVSPLCLSQTYPCSSEKPNYFNGLNYGVIVFNSNSDVNTTISKSIFRNVYRSILLSGTNQAVVTLNDIKVPNKDNAYSLPDNITTTETDKEPYGLYLYESTAFTVEENHFGAVDKVYAKISNTNGIVINNTFDNVNELYKNEFDTLQYAIVAMNQNREVAFGNLPFKGLEFLCNDMNDCFSDIDVTANTNNTGLIGVAKHQGLAYSNSTSNGYLSAENMFSWDGYKPASDFDNGIANNSIVYYHSPGQDKNQNSSSTDYWVPTYYSNLITSPVSTPTNVTLCGSKIYTGGDIITDFYTSLSSAKIVLNSSSLMLDIWQNGGIEGLGEQVESTTNPEAYQQFNELMSMSPYIEDGVLLEAINNPVFTALMIKLLMIANPQSSHNEELMSALENRVPAMPQSYIDEIRTGESVVSQLEHLEAFVAFDYHLFKSIADDITYIYRNDEENIWATDSLIAFLSRMDDVNSQYELAEVYLNSKQFDDMNTTLTDIGNRTDITETQIANHNEYVSYFSLISNLAQEGITIDQLSVEQITTLIAMEQSQSHFFSAYALSILRVNNSDYTFAESIVHSPLNSSRKSYKTDESNKSIENLLLNVFPNPANDYITVEYRTQGQYQSLSIEIYDITGRKILQKQLEGYSNDILISLSEFKPAVYMLQLIGDGTIIESKRITIIE